MDVLRCSKILVVQGIIRCSLWGEKPEGEPPSDELSELPDGEVTENIFS